jgi:methylphosphotriester-DNA--protein-cysteine methyltransferase
LETVRTEWWVAKQTGHAASTEWETSLLSLVRQTQQVTGVHPEALMQASRRREARQFLHSRQQEECA